MQYGKRKIAILFQTLILIVSVSGVVINCLFQETIGKAFNEFSYFTIQSNILVAIAMTLSLITLFKKTEISKTLRFFMGGVTLWIMVTGIVYHFLLSATFHPKGWLAIANAELHYIVPICFVLNWLVLEAKGQFKYIYSVFWLAYPLLFLLFSMIRGAFTGFYPYWFINPVRTPPDGVGSYGNMMIMAGILFVIFALIGVIIIFVDNRLSTSSKKLSQ